MIAPAALHGALAALALGACIPGTRKLDEGVFHTTADCRHYDFLGARAPTFEDLAVGPGGRIAFVVRSMSIKPDGAARVESVDSGRTWTATPL